MTKPASRKERSKITKALLFPILAIFFLVGWSLYWIGQKELKKPINKTTSKQKEELELTVISQEEQTLLS